ncbi:MAG: pantoate--beta-alanine ligase [Cyclobacteriaceae bacterium]
MQLFETIPALKAFLAAERRKGKSCGFVPTMGALHKGHQALIDKSLKDNDITVCSVYVNPTQFTQQQDLDKYPRKLEQDIALLEETGCQALFCPSDVVMYPEGKENGLHIQFGRLEQVLEGRFRPGHFSGVGLVLSKLFHCVQPERVYFGQKDLQQCSVVKKLIGDLFFDTQFVMVPTVRESSGLAMSSRNERLSPKGKLTASQLYRVLKEIKKGLHEGEAPGPVKQRGLEMLEAVEGLQPEYLEVIRLKDFEPVEQFMPEQATAVCVAAYVEEVRLIDNIMVTG